MQRQYLMGIDIGTQSTRAALLTTDGEAILWAPRGERR